MKKHKLFFINTLVFSWMVISFVIILYVVGLDYHTAASGFEENLLDSGDINIVGAIGVPGFILQIPLLFLVTFIALRLGIQNMVGGMLVVFGYLVVLYLYSYFLTRFFIWLFEHFIARTRIKPVKKMKEVISA
ncbi:hypothetical protein HY310_02750 [Candidatus Microgenomates bacterium]|nr:hypothetical protein [Candidatus Microgenomates bacterium]